MPVAVRVLAVREEALRHDEVQVVLGARHGDVEQAPLLLDLGGRAGAEIGGDAAVDDVEDEHRLPLLPLGRMDGRQDQIVLVLQRRAGFVAGGVRRIEGQLGEEALARGVAGGDLLQLHEIGAARRGVLVHAFEVRLVPVAGVGDLGRPAGAADVQRQHRLDEAGPLRLEHARRRRHLVQRGDRVRASCMRSSTRCAVVGPTPGISCRRRKPATRSRGFSAKRSSASTSLTCAASRNLRPPNFTNGMLRWASSTSSGPE